MERAVWRTVPVSGAQTRARRPRRCMRSSNEQWTISRKRKLVFFFAHDAGAFVPDIFLRYSCLRARRTAWESERERERERERDVGVR